MQYTFNNVYPKIQVAFEAKQAYVRAFKAYGCSHEVTQGLLQAFSDCVATFDGHTLQSWHMWEALFEYIECLSRGNSDLASVTSYAFKVWSK